MVGLVLMLGEFLSAFVLCLSKLKRKLMDLILRALKQVESSDSRLCTDTV